MKSLFTLLLLAILLTAAGPEWFETNTTAAALAFGDNCSPAVHVTPEPMTLSCKFRCFKGENVTIQVTAGSKLGVPQAKGWASCGFNNNVFFVNCPQTPLRCSNRDGPSTVNDNQATCHGEAVGEASTLTVWCFSDSTAPKGVDGGCLIVVEGKPRRDANDASPALVPFFPIGMTGKKSRRTRAQVTAWQAAAVMAFVGLAGPVGTAHELSYGGDPSSSCHLGMGGSVGFFDCGIGNHVALNLSIGGVCFGSTPDQGWDNGNAGFTDPVTGLPAGSTDLQHLTVGLGSTSTIDITDSVFALTPATYCQDLNDDALCGGNLTGEAETEPGGNPDPACQAVHREGSADCLFRSEPYVNFCDSITIFGGLTSPLAQGSRRIDGVAPGAAGSGDWADPTLDNWAIDYEVLIFVAGPGSGNPVLGAVCGGNAAWGTWGTVSHS